MSIIWRILLSSVLIFSVAADHHGSRPRILGGYVPGVSGMPPIDESTCLNSDIVRNKHVSNPVECARTCHVGEKPKICYYEFTLERYQISGHACNLCTPNVTNSVCANCQCIPGNGVQRSALVVNRMMPGPSIQVCLGDTVVIDVVNNINGAGVTIHWHGVFQKDYQYYDGVPNLTQCPIIFKNTFRYQFAVNNGGTHFWHAHTGLHKMDGIFGSLIVRVPASEESNTNLYDFDLANHVVVVNDWMNEGADERLTGRESGVTGQLPDSFLINGRGTYTLPDGTTTNVPLEVIPVEANRRYRFRLINAYCTTCGGQLTIEGHNLTAIETDGQPIKPVTVNTINSFAGERYDFVLNTNRAPGAYWIQLRALGGCRNRRIQQVAILQYIGASTQPKTKQPTYNVSLPLGIVLNPVDGNCNIPSPDRICISSLSRAVPEQNDLLQGEPDVRFYIPIGFRAYTLQDIFQPNTYKPFLVPGPGATLASVVDGISFQFPPSPPLSQLNDIPKNQFCNSRNLPRGCNNTCSCTNTLKIPLNAVVELVMVDESNVPDLTHPFHMHGYAFRVMAMGQPLGPTPVPANRSGLINVNYMKKVQTNHSVRRNYRHPPGKDTIVIPDNGYVVLRIRANNPGFWLFHCHFIYHQVVGMEIVLHVGEHSDVPPVPKGFPKCGDFQPKISDRYNPYGGYESSSEQNDMADLESMIESYL